MIHLFNRKELYLTFDQKEQYRVQNLLDDNSIEHRLIVKSRSHAGSRGRVAFGGHQTNAPEYRFYVLKNDYDKAFYLIHKK